MWALNLRDKCLCLSCIFWNWAKDCSGNGLMTCFQEVASRPSTRKPVVCLFYWRIRKNNRLRRSPWSSRLNSKIIGTDPSATFSRIGRSCWCALQRRTSIFNETNRTLRKMCYAGAKKLYSKIQQPAFWVICVVQCLKKAAKEATSSYDGSWLS